MTMAAYASILYSMAPQAKKILLRVPRDLYAKMESAADTLSMNAFINRCLLAYFDPPKRDDVIADLKSRNASLRELADGLRDALMAQQSEHNGALRQYEKKVAAFEAEQKLQLTSDEIVKLAGELLEKRLREISMKLESK